MSDTIYNAFKFSGKPFRYKVIGVENIQSKGPGIFVCNHLGSLGPVETIWSLPIRFYPWVVGELTDNQRAPDYLLQDFILPELHLDGRFGVTLSHIIAPIATFLITAVGSVPVESNRDSRTESFELSLDLLLKNENLLIFPEDDYAPLDPLTLMRAFKCGFLHLCKMYQEAAGVSLPVYPVAVNPKSKTIAVGNANFIQSTGDNHLDIRQFCGLLEGLVRDLYLGHQQRA